MTESNYDILKISDGASKREIREAYRNLVLEIHSDRGGDDEQFKKIKQAYEDLKVGKKYADSIKVKRERQKFFQVIQLLINVEKIFFYLVISR